MNKIDEFSKSKKEFYERIKNALTYTGVILAAVAAIAYLILVYIIIYGFQVDYSKNQLIAFIVLGAVVGLLINIAMRIQGIDFAKLTPVANKTLKELTDSIGKSDEVKMRPMWVMFLSTILKDIVIKGGAIGFTLYYTIDISYSGLGEEKYFLLALANIILYFGLGLISMSKAYDYYLESHVPYLEQKIKKLKKGVQNEGHNRNIRSGDSGNAGCGTTKEVELEERTHLTRNESS